MGPTSINHACNPRAIDDIELVDRTRQGCTRSFDLLVERFRPRLVQLLIARCNGSYQDAEDVAQEALTRAYQELAHFNPRFRFSTWIFTIAFRMASDHRRRSRKVRWFHLESAHESGTLSPALASTDTRDQAQSVWRIARRMLADSQYTAMWLKYGEDLSVAEIARIMRKTQIGVRVLLHRARIRLAHSLDPIHHESQRDD